MVSGLCLTRAPQAGPAVSAVPVLLWLFPPSSRVVTNSPSSLLLLQFEDVVWDYSLPADREELKKDKRSRRGKRQGASAEQQRARDKSLRSRQGPKSRGRPKSITLSLFFSGFSKLTYKPRSRCLQSSQYSDSAAATSRCAVPFQWFCHFLGFCKTFLPFYKDLV